MVIDWFLGAIAECCWHIARFHVWRGDRHLARARRATAAADKWSKRQQRADRVQMLAVEGQAAPRVSY